MRHEYASWAFVHIGVRVWTHPLAEWHFHSSHVHAYWRQLPEWYPPGLFAVFLPFGALSNLNLVRDTHVHALEVAFLGAVAVFAAFQLVRTLRLFYEPTLTIVLGAIGSVLFVTWAVDGFVDPLVAGLALLGIYWAERDAPGRGLLALSAALSIHFRLWYLWPLAIAIAVRERRRIARWQLVTAVALGVVSLAAFLLAIPAVSKLGRVPQSEQNYLALRHGLNGERAIAIVGAVLGLVVVYLAERRWTPVACVALAMTIIFGVNQWEAWYTIMLFPLFLVVRRPWSQAIVMLGFLEVTIILGSGLTNVMRAVHLYYRAVLH
jgi:hypothetical protein